MARQTDTETVSSLWLFTRRKNYLEKSTEVHDAGKLCPGCSRAFSDSPTPSQSHFGELFCGRCIESFKQSSFTHNNLLTAELKNL